MSKSAAAFEAACETALPLEHAIARIWADVLGVELLPGATATFFELGGDSISMMMVLYRINEELGIDLPPAALLESPGFNSFCELATAARGAR
jgi:acyl carrier protein